MPAAVPLNTPKTRLGVSNNEADQERLLSTDNSDSEDNAGFGVDDNDSGSAQPNQASTSTNIIGMGIDEEGLVKPEGRRGDGWARNVAFTSIALLTGTTWFLVLANNPFNLKWFAFHPPLQSLALCFFTYGVMTLQPTSQPKTKAAGFIRHQTAVFYFGFPLILAGTSAAVLHKILEDYKHFQSWHATFGLLCIVWLLVQVFLGAGSVWNGGSLFGGGMRAKAIWKYHRLSGYILFTLMLYTAHLGWGEKTAGKWVRIVVYTIAPLATGISVWFRVRTSKMKFF
ncbi:hypothetical protein NP233_g2837 [Leucocoprinus birnbaumii]|uniref:Cytochrome b561 domain-containing protein n=1 Tax=Leucocoprinus birnbaumii TaxID=56174 RepID=A0AAD5W3X6_9AGAR|nr:hypothetical protein NP233_g2837 [Leucocoprinus birnbaumii]